MSTIARKLKMARVAASAGEPAFTRLYGASQAEGIIYNIDISDPSNMSVLATSGIGVSPISLAIDEENYNLYVGTETTLVSYNISGDSFSQLQSYFDGFYSDNVSSTQIDTGRNLLFINSNDHDLLLSFDISNPSNMIPTGEIYSATLYDGLLFTFYDNNNEILYSVSYNDGYFTSTDLSFPYGNTGIQTLNSLLASNNFRSSSLDVDLSSDVAFVLGQGGNFFSPRSITSIDISDPSNLSIISSFTGAEFSGFFTYGFEIDDSEKVAYIPLQFDYSFVNASGIVCVDISNPSSMSVISSFSDPLLERPVALSLDKASKILYVTTNPSSKKLVAVDVSDPSNLSIISHITGNYFNSSNTILAYAE